MAEKRKGNEYSVYAGIDDSPPINWGTVAGTISNQLLAVKKDREAQKQAIEQQTVDQMAELNKLPDVNDRSLSKILIEGSDRSKQELQMRMQLVRSGALKPKDYTLFMNEQKNGYSEFSNVIKNWDKWNEKKMESIKNGTASAFDKANALSIEAFGNLQNKVIMTNPANGQLQVVTMLKDKDGKYTKMPDAKKNPENFAAPGTLNSRMAFDEEKKETSVLVNKEIEFIGDHIEATRYNNGVVETVEDFTQADGYPAWKEASIQKLTSNDYDIVQVLSEDSRYAIASSKEEFEKNNPGVDLKYFIEMDQSGNKPVPVLTKDQKEAAQKMVGDAIESQLTYKQEKSQGFKDSADDNKRKDEDTDDVGYIKELDIIMHGDPLEAEAALKRRIDTKNQDPNTPLDEKIVSFEITDDQIILRRAKGDPLTIDRVADTGVADDPKTAEDESVKTLSNLDDVVAINDLISPKKLSRGRIEKLIEKEGITLGKRRKGGVGSKVGKSEIPATTPTALAPDGTSLSSQLIDKFDEKLGMMDGDNKIKAEITAAVQKFMPAELSKELSDNPSLYGPTTIKKVPNMEQMELTIGGESVIINTNTGASTATIVEKINEAMNKAREKVNKNRTSSKVNKKNNKDKPSFIKWRETNPNGKVEDWKKATGR